MAMYYTLPAHRERGPQTPEEALEPASAVNFTGVDWEAYGDERGAPRRATGPGYETERNRPSRDDRAAQPPKSGITADGEARNDEGIKREILLRMMNFPELGGRDILVNVIEGKVALFGSVDSHEAKRLASEVCQQVAGVIDIQNELRITEFR